MGLSDNDLFLNLPIACNDQALLFACGDIALQFVVNKCVQVQCLAQDLGLWDSVLLGHFSQGVVYFLAEVHSEAGLVITHELLFRAGVAGLGSKKRVMLDMGRPCLPRGVLYLRRQWRTLMVVVPRFVLQDTHPVGNGVDDPDKNVDNPHTQGIEMVSFPHPDGVNCM